MAETVRLIQDQWRPGRMTDGPVRIVIIVFTDDGELMGAAPVTRPPRWLWRDGRLCIDYSPVSVTAARAGRFSTALICAVSPDTGVYQPLWPVSLGPPQELSTGNSITIADGVISIIPDLPGPHG